MGSIRGKAVAVAAIVIGLGAVGPVASATTESDRAMWVWVSPDTGVLDFAVVKGVTTLYLHTPPGFSSDTSHATFLAEAHAAGLTVYAAAGDPSWAKKASPMSAWVDEVVGYGGFDGLIVDVEPYLLSDWNHSKKQRRLIANYLKGLDGAAGRSGDLPFVATVPFWFDDPAFDVRSESLVGEILDRVDGLMVMAYRDHAEGPDGIIEHAATEVSLASARGKFAVVGVESGAAGLDKVTFAEEGEAAMEQALSEVSSTFGGTGGFGGVAIHHYETWATLTP